MVKEVKHKGKSYFMCEACNMYYLSRDLAKKCEDFCKKNRACNIDLIKHAVEL